MKEDSDARLLSDTHDKFDKWKQVVETWCVPVSLHLRSCLCRRSSVKRCFWGSFCLIVV
jgi:hypothetical protein